MRPSRKGTGEDAAPGFVGSGLCEAAGGTACSTQLARMLYPRPGRGHSKWNRSRPSATTSA